jgi:TonB family protein
MKILKKILLTAGLIVAASGAVASNGLYEEGIVGLGGLNVVGSSTAPQPVSLYPKLALRRGVEGTVQVEYNVNAAGKVENIQVISSSPKNFFVNATVRTLKSATFGVAYENGVPVPITGVKKQFSYKIERGSEGNSQPLVAIN